MHDGRFQSNILIGRNHFEELAIEAMIILNWILEKYHMNTCTGFV